MERDIDPLARAVDFARALREALDAGRPSDEVWRLAMDEFLQSRAAGAAVAAASLATKGDDREGALLAIALAFAFGETHSALWRHLAQALARRGLDRLAQEVMLLAWERYVEEVRSLGGEPPPGLREDYLKVVEEQTGS